MYTNIVTPNAKTMDHFEILHLALLNASVCSSAVEELSVTIARHVTNNELCFMENIDTVSSCIPHANHTMVHSHFCSKHKHLNVSTSASTLASAAPLGAHGGAHGAGASVSIDDDFFVAAINNKNKK
jgi:hypothetical protein